MTTGNDTAVNAGEPLTTPDPGYEICHDCDGKRVCRMCHGRRMIGGKRCVLCGGAGICSECEGAGQLRKGD